MPVSWQRRIYCPTFWKQEKADFCLGSSCSSCFTRQTVERLKAALVVAQIERPGYLPTYRKDPGQKLGAPVAAPPAVRFATSQSAAGKAASRMHFNPQRLRALAKPARGPGEYRGASLPQRPTDFLGHFTQWVAGH